MYRFAELERAILRAVVQAEEEKENGENLG